MKLSSVFTHVAHKQLVAVDLPNSGSNQHELNGVAALRDFFGTGGASKGTLEWRYFADDQETVNENAEFTFYDARAKSAPRTKRSEWRFYYYGNFLTRASVGDWFFLAQATGGRLFALIFERNSGWLRAAKILFGVESSTPSFDSIDRERLDNQQLELLRRGILTELGLEVALPIRQRDEEIISNKFGRKFPTTKEMSVFARTQVAVDTNSIDEALVRWLDREEELFLALERLIIRERLSAGFYEVEDFIDFSMSVHQRRKSRMGFALQNHLAEIFDRQKIDYTPQARTEGKRKPDFIFPGQKAYLDPAFDATLLVMLGAKSTCKDRWRQILVEASRIPHKHLCTLEAGISTQQTDEMKEERVTLVIPASLHSTYTIQQHGQIMSLSEFVTLLRRKK